MLNINKRHKHLQSVNGEGVKYMRRRNSGNDELQIVRTGGIEEACSRYGLGKNSMRHVAEDSQAVIRIGKRYLINFAKVDAYMDNMSQQYLETKCLKIK